MTTTETETMLVERLSRLADYAPARPTVEFSDLPMARVTEASHRRAPVWAVAAGVAVVLGAGTIAALTPGPGSNPTRHAHTLGPAGTAMPTEPTAPAVHALTIAATDFHYQVNNFKVPAGVTEINLVSNEGSHTLRFAEPELSYVALTAPAGRTSVKVDLVEGHVYTIFCAIAGHRQSGMEATITVGPPAQAK